MAAYARVASRLFNTTLMVHPGKAAAIAAGIGARVAPIGKINGAEAVAHVAFEHGRPAMGILGDRLGRAYERMGEKPYDQVGNVAFIPVEGSLVHKGEFCESESGETSYQGIQTQVAAALKDPTVRGVVFEVDSFGGEVAGAFETSDKIFELSSAKPTIAILTDYAYSAGYLMASAARQIIIPEQGGAGSIGVITMHVDMSKALAESGLSVTILTAGAHKADGNPYEPLPVTVADDIRTELEAARQAFSGRVAAYRGNRLNFEAAMATEARTFRGAEAVAAGLADATGHPSDALTAFISALNRA